MNCIQSFMNIHNAPPSCLEVCRRRHFSLGPSRASWCRTSSCRHSTARCCHWGVVSVSRGWCQLAHLGNLIFMSLFFLIIVIFLTQWTVSWTEIGLVRLGEEDPVPAELVEVDDERPETALSHLRETLSTFSVGDSQLTSGSNSSEHLLLVVRFFLCLTPLSWMSMVR